MIIITTHYIPQLRHSFTGWRAVLSMTFGNTPGHYARVYDNDDDKKNKKEEESTQTNAIQACITIRSVYLM